MDRRPLRDFGPVHPGSGDGSGICRFRIRRIDEDDELLPLFRIVDDRAETLREFVERVVEEVELEDVGVEERGAVVDALVEDR